MHLRRYRPAGFGPFVERLSTGFRAAVACVVCMLGLACSNGHRSNDPTCTDEEPTFVVSVRAGDAPLPADTVVTVQSGGTTEQYPPEGNRSMLFCTEVGAGDLDAGADLEEIQCSLYTGQAAALTVTASGYPSQEITLTVERSDDDCILTREEQLVLLPGDAGS